jgi:hypothetical protein
MVPAGPDTRRPHRGTVRALCARRGNIREAPSVKETNWDIQEIWWKRTHEYQAS